jgi:hypothetical protein
VFWRFHHSADSLATSLTAAFEFLDLEALALVARHIRRVKGNYPSVSWREKCCQNLASLCQSTDVSDALQP